MKANPKRKKIDTMRMKDIVAQLTDIIYLLCDAKEKDAVVIMDQFTNLTKEELDSLHIIFPTDTES